MTTQLNPDAQDKLDWSGATNRVDSQALETFWLELDARCEAGNQARRDRQAQRMAAGYQAAPISSVPFSDCDRQALSDYLESTDRLPPKCSSHMAMPQVMQGIEALAAAGALTPIAALKMILFFQVRHDPGEFVPAHIRTVFELLHRKSGRPTLLELAAMLQETGMSERAPLLAYCSNKDAIARTWPDEHVRPYFARHADELRRMLADRKGFMVTLKLSAPVATLIVNTGTNRPAVYRAIGLVAGKSGALVDALFDIALGTVASERVHAQATLREIEGIETRVIQALSAKNAKTRTAAAEWLARLKSTSTVSPQV